MKQLLLSLNEEEIDMKKIIFFTLTMTLCSPLFSMQIYECKGEDNIPYFSETPCGSDAIIHEVDSTPASSATGSNTSDQQNIAEEYEQGKKRSRLRSIDAKIKRLQSEIDSLTAKKDKEIEVYRKKILRNEEKAGKNKTKAALRNKGHNERIVSIEENYNRKITNKQNRISVLNEEKDSIK